MCGLAASLGLLVACKRHEAEVEIAETRGKTTKDTAMKLFATSDERFRNAQRPPVEGLAPASWLALPSSQFRLLNYRFGESGTGEVWVSLASGSVADNVNRWLGQFGATPLDGDGMKQLRTVSLAGSQGVWVEAEGTYNGGMGAEPKSGQALAGVIAMANGSILTVKMVGPKAEVAAAKSDLEAFVASLKLTEPDA